MSTDNSSNNKRIAKNTLMLYIRMAFMLVLALFTSRVVLDTLGEEDFGTYNVVGGFVAMFSVISGPLSTAIQRFITYELGTGNKAKLETVFSTAIHIQVIIAIIVFILCETIGIWFVNTQMNIPEGRMGAANFILQISIATFVIQLINVQNVADVIAHEKMSFFAYLSIVEYGLKLLIVYLIASSPFDRLKFYGALLFCIQFLIWVAYYLYCRRNFDEARYCKYFDKSLFKDMASFAGWNFFGNTAYILNTQGVNMLINVFFGVKMNTARALAVQVDSALQMFITSFTTALNPQITKSYALNDKSYVFQLISRGSKFSYLILFMLLVPVVLEAETILCIWLKQVPDDTVLFLQLLVWSTLFSCLGKPMVTGILATGNIGRYEIWATITGGLVFPLTWIAYKMGMPAFTTYIILAIIELIVEGVRLLSLKRLMDFPVGDYIKNVISRLLVFSLTAFVAPLVIVHIMSPSIFRLILVCAVSAVWSSLCIYVIALDKSERDSIVRKIIRTIKEKIMF